MSKKIKKKLTVPEEQFNSSWDAIFGKQKTMEDFVDEAMKEEYSKISEEFKNEQ